ncbi:MAG TPA: hypothetical protein VFR78_19800 [Pyrinomonadaceae bacterium]|nr:hypothetical protein [Pyrinomonadaceae bacterium]
MERALLLAQLSNLWWESERNQANTWIEKSVDAIAFYPAEEVKQQRPRFFQVTRQVLALISMHNKKQSTRLVRILSDSEKEIPDNEKKLNAEALIEQALGFVNTDAARAAELGRVALALEFPPNAYRLALALRGKNPDLANQFVKAALLSVSTTPTTARLFSLQRMAFPEHGNANVPANLLPPRELKISFLNFVAEHLRQRQLAFSSKQIGGCADEAVFATRLRSSFTELLPEKAPLVEQAIEICLAHVKPQTKQLLNRDLQKTDVEEMLKEADGIQNDPMVRGRYLLNAALAAVQQKKWPLAIQILEKMNDDERKVDVEFWEDLRLDAGAALAVAEFKEGDVPRAQQTLKDLPEPLRSLGQITFVVQISPQDVTCSQFCTDLLNEAKRSIGKSELRFGRKSSYWLVLTKLYSEFKLQTEAAETFREMVTAFNNARTDGNASNNDALSSQFLTDSKRVVPGFSLKLFEEKQDSLFESVELLNDQQLRTHINLEFLKMSLGQYQALKAESAKKPDKG